MRRLWISGTVVAVLIFTLLYFGGVFTGQLSRELQNPYSRLRKSEGQRFGFAVDRTYPNAMSDYYQSLKGDKPRDVWVPSESSYRLTPGLSAPDYINQKGEVPSVTWLKLDIELTFLRSLKNDKTRLAVIRSLYQRKEGKDAGDRAAIAWNDKQRAKEATRIRRIYRWYELDRKNYGVPFEDWWRDNAAVFGLTREGDPLPIKEARR